MSATVFSQNMMTDPTAAPKLSHNELLKEGDPTLAGTIAQTLADPQADCFIG